MPFLGTANTSTAAACVSQITRVTDDLYVCGVSAIRKDRLLAKKITTIINVTLQDADCYQRLPPHVAYIQIRIEDDPSTDIASYFDSTAERIETTRTTSRGRTLVYCGAGVSRSPTLCLAYQIRYGGMSLREAYFSLKHVRPIVRPNIGFWRQLIAYEKRLTGSPTVTLVNPTLYSSGGGSGGRKGSSIYTNSSSKFDILAKEVPDVYIRQDVLAEFGGGPNGTGGHKTSVSKSNSTATKTPVGHPSEWVPATPYHFTEMQDPGERTCDPTSLVAQGRDSNNNAASEAGGQNHAERSETGAGTNDTGQNGYWKINNEVVPAKPRSASGGFFRFKGLRSAKTAELVSCDSNLSGVRRISDGYFTPQPPSRRYGVNRGDATRHLSIACESDDNASYSRGLRTGKFRPSSAGQRYSTQGLLLPAEGFGFSEFGGSARRRPLGAAPGLLFKPRYSGGGGKGTNDGGVFGSFTAFCDSFVPGF